MFETKYGHFSSDGEEFIVTNPKTPRPWVNIICPGDYGMTISQTGGGYSWQTHASLNRITRWNQDLIVEDWGKYIYIRDEESKEIWSPTWKPVCADLENYECHHGFGYTRFITKSFGIESELLFFVPPTDPCEIWQLKLTNKSQNRRTLSLWTYLEWCCGESPDAHREFHKTFLETKLDKQKKAIFASKRLWTIVNSKGQHWNRSWEYVAWHSSNHELQDMSGDKDSFIGRYATFANPQALKEGKYLGKTTGKWDDSIGSLKSSITLEPGETKTIVWTLGIAKSEAEAAKFIQKYQDNNKSEEAFRSVREFWKSVLTTTEYATPDAGFNFLANRWLKYQTLSARFWGRTGYYQAGGAYGYRDQLQDSQVFLHIDPEGNKKQILLHASHQYPNGTVHHWWHPITGEGHKSRYSDDLLWVPFILLNYLKETGNLAVLKEKVPFLQDDSKKKTAPAPLYQHCILAIENSLKRQSKRGLPLIGTGDWNDGLSVAGWNNKGESVWVAMFLYGILNQFCTLIEKAVAKKAVPPQEMKRISKFKKEAEKLLKVVNKSGWDGDWYWAASCDDGSLIGSKKSAEGKIHLNPQTWSIMNGMVPPERMASVLSSLEKYLYKNYGPVLLSPAYKTPDEKIGYLTRYAPGVRENGGLYTHAGTWAVQMECFLKRNEKAWDLYKKISPIDRGMDPDLYMAEPYVTPGNVDGPDSPYYGRGGWTWYTGSSGWFYRIMTEWILGVRPDWEGLKVAPVVPSHWNEFKMKRPYRGKICQFSFQRDGKLSPGGVRILYGEKELESDIIPNQWLESNHTKEIHFTVYYN